MDTTNGDDLLRRVDQELEENGIAHLVEDVLVYSQPEFSGVYCDLNSTNRRLAHQTHLRLLLAQQHFQVRMDSRDHPFPHIQAAPQ